MNTPLLLTLAVCALLVADLILWCIFVPPTCRGWVTLLRVLPGSGFFYYVRNLLNR
jgi:hypothetical protein